MKTPLLQITLALVAAMPMVSYAQDSNLSKQFAACMDQSGGVTMDMIECIGSETQRQDVRLNKAYKAVAANQIPERKKQLQEVQRIWIKFRDANCDFYYDPNGGSMARVSANSCMMTMTADRAKELENLAQ